MIRPSDKSYQDTKKIMLGKAKMNPDFKPLAEFIDYKFNVKVINIIYDTIESGQPRLNICFEFDQGEENKYWHYLWYDKERKKTYYLFYTL